MELKIKLEQLNQRVNGLKDQIQTEEATKNAFILPFIQILGYDIFNPTEVIPEYVADIGTKKGEKVDYMIMKDGEPVLIVECKHWKEDVNAHNSQLHRYYIVSKARFGVLTNGIVYNFYTDLENQNIMDEKPFLTINLDDLKENSIKVLEKFAKTSYDLTSILDSAESLKYVKAIRSEFEAELNEPSDEFIRLLVSRFFNKSLTANRIELFKEYTKRALTNSINDMVNSRLKDALNMNTREAQQEEAEIDDIENDSKIVTTEEEIEAFQIVKAILREVVSADRISFRDTQSYFGILLDDNNRKPLCRLRLNSQNTKYIELFHNGKDHPEKIKISSLDDIYNYKIELQKTIEIYN
ncbi:MAG: type I restriction endonuclease [Bergeyella cardium]